MLYLSVCLHTCQISSIDKMLGLPYNQRIDCLANLTKLTEEKMTSIKMIGKCIDQPMVIAKFSKAVTPILIGGAALTTYHDVRKQKNKDQKKKTLIKNLCTWGGTITAALIATKGLKPIEITGKLKLKPIEISGKFIFNGINGLSNKVNLKRVTQEQTNAISEFLSTNKISAESAKILEKMKTKIANPKDIATLSEEFHTNTAGLKLIDRLIPNPKNISSKEIFGEIRRLSLMGLVPVIGGISGGIVGDKLTEKNWKEKVPNKIKEGTYQYLANIFLCNVGAGAALGIMEKLNIRSKGKRAAGMIAGIITTGVVGGSAIANVISKKLIDPILGKRGKKEGSLYCERKPEALDIGLHVDDVATVAVMSGLKWIEPALPILYSISGYRAGIGYRNGSNDKEQYNNSKYAFMTLPAPNNLEKPSFKYFS